MKRPPPDSIEPLDPLHKQLRASCPSCGAPLGGSGATIGCGTCPGRFCAACVGAHQRPPDPSGHACCAATGTTCAGCGRTYCNLLCGASVAPCAACLQLYCNACNHPTAQDAGGHLCCPTTGIRCRGCQNFFCNDECEAGHPRGTDPAGHPVCPAVPHAQCPACHQLYCFGQCAPVHAVDVGGHHVCTSGPYTSCPVCLDLVCDAVCKTVHTVAVLTCGHQSCPATAGTVATCAACRKRYCGACKGANITVDVCGTCLAEKHYGAGPINVRYALIPGRGGALSRTHSVEGPIRVREVGKRETPPPPLSSVKTVKKAQIGDMKQWDRGHLIALELDGRDDSYAIAPMIRQFNRAGTWRKMEETIVGLLKGTDAEDVNGGTVAATGSAPTAIDVSLRTDNTVDVKWHMEVYLFYHDTLGDTRVPVWFYVRVLRKKKLRTHFSLANRCNEPAALPSRTESIEFQAATDIYAALAAAKRNQIVSETTRPMYADDVAPPPPNKILEFMDEVNAYCRANFLDEVFTTMQAVVKKKSAAYDDFQRPILRKYNRWKHAGTLTSDVPTDWLYELERKDVYQVLSECGNRSAPEVDHVNPSYQGGGNYYINARLVSFYHNHLYREKKVLGSQKVNEELLAIYQTAANPRPLAFMSTTAVKSDLTGRDTLKLRFWTTTGERVQDASVVEATITITSDSVVSGATTAADFLNTYFEDDVLFETDGRTLKPDVGVAYWPYRNGTVWTMVQARQTFLQAYDSREKKYAAEMKRLPKYKKSTDAHEAGLAAFIADKDHPERKRLLKLIADAKDPGDTALPLCRPSDELLEGGGLKVVSAAGVYVDLRDDTARGEKHYTDLVDIRWEAVKKTLT